MTPIERPRSNSQEAQANCQEAPDRDDLSWTAMLYVAGDLSGSELAAFEQRLANDTAACEAVGQAVLLAQATAAAFEAMSEHFIESSPSTNSASPARAVPGLLRSRRFVAGLAASAVAATAVALISEPFAPAPEAVVREYETRQAVELLHEWSNAGDNIDSILADARDSLPGDLSDELSDTRVPEWMLIAVQASVESGEPQVMEN